MEQLICGNALSESRLLQVFCTESDTMQSDARMLVCNIKRLLLVEEINFVNWVSRV